MLLATLSPLLGSHTIAQELHNLGIDSQLRFTNLVFATDDMKQELFEELETRGVSVLHRRVLAGKLGEPGTGFGR
ncbi:hypothetical protein RQP46_010485 [Phenoliferia psychrophenolica]